MYYLVYVGVMVLFSLLGVLFLKGKGAFLIAGYNTMSEAEKKTMDEKALCGFMGKVMFFLAAGVALWGIGDLLEQKWVFDAGLLLFLGAVGFTVVYANTGNRFKK